MKILLEFFCGGFVCFWIFYEFMNDHANKQNTRDIYQSAEGLGGFLWGVRFIFWLT